MLWLVVRGGIEQGCCCHGRWFSIGPIPEISRSLIVWVAVGGRSETAGIMCQKKRGKTKKGESSVVSRYMSWIGQTFAWDQSCLLP